MDNENLFKNIDAVQIMALQAKISALEESQRPQGEWKLLYKFAEGQKAGYACSICQRKIHLDKRASESLADYPFCHCGADMRGKKE